MDFGTLWLDDSARDLSEKVLEAARCYRKKFDQQPNTCYVHPSVSLEGAEEVDGIEIRHRKTVLRYHYWIGVEKANGEKAKAA